MRPNRLALLLPLLLPLLLAAPAALACTNLIVSPGATVDGSTYVTYTCDGEFHPTLTLIEPGDHEPGAMQDITDWGGKVLGQVPYPAHTWRVVNLQNEHQVAIGETTTTGRAELRNPDGLLHYWTLMRLALQRATTAREAIEVMGRLVKDHGYASTGESFAVADPREAWIMEMIGPGPGDPQQVGAHWVAIRVPDGMISAYANGGRIGTIPDDGGKTCLHSDLDAMKACAREHGWWDPKAGPFNWREAFYPTTAQEKRYTAARVWSLFRRAAPSQDFPVDYHRGVPGAEPYPLFVKPDRKLTTADVFQLMRDHYDGTAYDMGKGVDAGPYGNPVRYRPMGFSVDGESYTWERPISTQQTGFSMVCQARKWLPDAVGGVSWYGVDNTEFTCYAPLYCSIEAIPASFATGTLRAFSWDSAWWVFNLVSNYAMLRYDAMIKDVRAAQADIEGTFLDLQPAVESTAAALAGKDPDLMRRYLTDYSVEHAELVTRRWKQLAEYLLTTYNDGYVKDANGRPREQGYEESWLRTVLQARPDQFRLPEDAPQAAEPKDY